MLTNNIDDNVYENALSLAKQSELENDVKNLIVSLNGINEVFNVEESEINKQAEETMNENIENVDVAEKEVDINDLIWLEGALDIQNKNAFEKNEYENIKKVNEQLTNELNGIYVEVETLNNARLDALKAFDIAEVVKIDNQLNKLQGLYTQKINEVNNYKNNIKNSEAEYNKKYKELEDSLTNVNLNSNDIKINKAHFGNKILNDYKNNRVLSTIKGFLSNYSKEQCKNILQNSPELIAKLGDNYNKLMEEFA